MKQRLGAQGRLIGRSHGPDRLPMQYCWIENKHVRVNNAALAFRLIRFWNMDVAKGSFTIQPRLPTACPPRVGVVFK